MCNVQAAENSSNKNALIKSDALPIADAQIHPKTERELNPTNQILQQFLLASMAKQFTTESPLITVFCLSERIPFIITEPDWLISMKSFLFSMENTYMQKKHTLVLTLLSSAFFLVSILHIGSSYYPKSAREYYLLKQASPKDNEKRTLPSDLSPCIGTVGSSIYLVINDLNCDRKKAKTDGWTFVMLAPFFKPHC